MKKIYSLSVVLFFSIQCIFSQCYKDRHSTLESDHWESCTLTENPNPIRENSHWIMYDFGLIYSLGESTFWNCNMYNKIDNGIKSMSIDYSYNGIDWKEWGEFELEKATASSFYEGTTGPNFQGLGVRYLLITVTEQFENATDCACLSEIKIQTNGETTVNTKELFLNASVTTFPNPVIDIVNINITTETQLDNLNINLIDTNGKIINQVSKGKVIGSKEFQLDLSDIPSGNYLLQFNANGLSKTQKLVIIDENKN